MWKWWQVRLAPREDDDGGGGDPLDPEPSTGEASLAEDYIDDDDEDYSGERGERDDEGEEDDDEGTPAASPARKADIDALRQEIDSQRKQVEDLRRINAGLLAREGGEPPKPEPKPSKKAEFVSKIKGKTGAELLDVLEEMGGDALVAALTEREESPVIEEVETLRQQLEERDFREQFPELRDIYTDFPNEAAMREAMSKPPYSTFFQHFNELKTLGGDPKQTRAQAARLALREYKRSGGGTVNPMRRSPAEMDHREGRGGAMPGSMSAEDLAFARRLGINPREARAFLEKGVRSFVTPKKGRK